MGQLAMFRVGLHDHAQVVGNELATACGQRDAAAEEARGLGARLASAEQLLRAKESEVEDLRAAYEGLALENRRWGTMLYVCMEGEVRRLGHMMRVRGW